jgi:peptidoglycan/xylan/chitin deacetylase (PgdA/CDA1 family)
MSSVTLPAETPPLDSTSTRTSIAYVVRNIAPRVAALLPSVICRAKPFDAAGAPCVYLTFDDGPIVGATPRILNALDRHDARATHFLLGSSAEKDPKLARAILDAGHAVGNHGWEHRDAWRSRGAAENLDRGRTWLEDAVGRAVPETRPPFGRLTPSIYRWARAGGHRLVLWDLMPGDYLASSSAAALAGRLTGSARPGSIVVLHDGPHADRAISILDLAVPALRARGWRFPSL